MDDDNDDDETLKEQVNYNFMYLIIDIIFLSTPVKLYKTLTLFK